MTNKRHRLDGGEPGPLEDVDVPEPLPLPPLPEMPGSPEEDPPSEPLPPADAPLPPLPDRTGIDAPLPPLPDRTGIDAPLPPLPGLGPIAQAAASWAWDAPQWFTFDEEGKATESESPSEAPPPKRAEPVPPPRRPPPRPDVDPAAQQAPAAAPAFDGECCEKLLEVLLRIEDAVLQINAKLEELL